MFKTHRLLLIIALFLFVVIMGSCGGGGGGGGGTDTTSPTTPTGLTATAVSSSQINLSWNVSTDNVGVAGYKVYRNGAYLKSVTSTSTSDTGLNPATKYCYKVSAYDAEGNKSGLSSEACATTHSGGAGQGFWAKTYGGIGGEWIQSIQQTSDGGYVVAGWTKSFGAGWEDIWVLKLDSNGNVQWQKTYGGTKWDEAYSIQQTNDGGYVVAGYTASFGAVNGDSWVLKLDSNGNIQWQKTYGGTGWDWAFSIQQTSDGGHVVAGRTSSSGAGYSDFWVLKLDSNGNVKWQKTYGGTDVDFAYSIQQTSDGGYVVAGKANLFGTGNVDFWVLKLDPNGSITFNPSSRATTKDTNATVTDTSVNGVTSSATVTDTAVTGVDTNATVTDTNTTVTQQAPFSGSWSEL